MVWYKPWTWGNKTQDATVLYCDNPQCGKPIKGDEFAFDMQSGKLYHPEGCAMMDCVLQAFNTGNTSFVNVAYINREQAAGIDRKRKEKSGGLEKKVE